MNCSLTPLGAVLALCLALSALAPIPAAEPDGDSDVFRRENLVAWCIVPFDAAKRSPAQRAVMLKELGLTRCAYDWREEHVASFEDEIVQYQKQGIELFAFWDAHETAFALFEKYDLHPQIWKTSPSPPGASQEAKVAAAVEALVPLAERTSQLKCELGLYNHGDWGGEPRNLVAVCQQLRSLGHDHVGIVYNLHHGHGHIADWAESLRLMRPYLLCLNLNGMNDAAEPKILGIGKGQHDVAMLRAVLESGYSGPIGVIDHRPELDTRAALQENLDGLRKIGRELAEKRRADVGVTATYDADRVVSLAAEARERGDIQRGARLFASAKHACLSCHRIGERGGATGPELLSVCKDRELTHLIESVLWPQREVKPEYTIWRLLTSAGQVLSGYRVASNDNVVDLRDVTSGAIHSVPADEVEQLVMAGTLMPDQLTAAMSGQQLLDLIRFLDMLRNPDAGGLMAIETAIHDAQQHAPATFDYDRTPLRPERWPSWQSHVNRDRVYDFYTKQAEHYRAQTHLPMLLSPFPGLDDGRYGHWGNQQEATWTDARWNGTTLGSLQAGVLHGEALTVPRAVCLKLGDRGELSACFDPETLSYRAIWSGGFVKFSPVRHGFMHGLLLEGELQPLVPEKLAAGSVDYHGFYRFGKRVVFAYRIGEVEYLDAPWVEDGKFVHELAPVEAHSLRHVLQGGPAQWPQTLATKIIAGESRPYSIDTIELPAENPWKALLFCGGHDFLEDGAALICTMQGDVWRVDGLDSGTARWRRFASGLHQPLGLLVTSGEIYVQCRDQLTRLHDLNGDGEADFYECFNNTFRTSAAGHDFICGLQRDAEGNFYTASGSQGLLRISADGERAEVRAVGFRNPDGVGIYPDGTLTVPCSEGEWTPASMICAVRPRRGDHAPPHYGYGGPRDGEPPMLPLAYLPRGIDNSSGEQIHVASDRWGPLQDQMVHLSFGSGSHSLLLRDEVDGQLQGAIVPLAGEFRSGVHRGRFHPLDGQLYVSGMAGWGSYTSDDGCFQRVRYSGGLVQLPVAFHVYRNGITVTFSRALDKSIAEQTASHFAQSWNYSYSEAYGSAEYSPSHRGVAGHDPLVIASAHVLPDGRTLFLELPDVQPVNQLHLRLNVDSGDGHDLFVTVHRLDVPFKDFPGYRPEEKTVAAHPLLADLAFRAARVPNPWLSEIAGTRPMTIEAGKNLTFTTRTMHGKAGEPISITFVNPDVVPHNWVLVRPDKLAAVGDLANRLIADPDAAARHYIPASDDVLAYTDVVPPGGQFTIHLRAPKQPGHYPYLCTFPGHWMVMNGVLVVE